MPLAADITVEATPPALPLSGTSTLGRVARRPGGRALRDALGTGPDGRPAGILGSEGLLAITGNMPPGALAAFPGLGVTDELIGRLVRAVGERHAEANPGA